MLLQLKHGLVYLNFFLCIPFFWNKLPIEPVRQRDFLEVTSVLLNCVMCGYHFEFRCLRMTLKTISHFDPDRRL